MTSGVDVAKLQPMMSSVCEVLLQNTRELPSPQNLRRIRDEQDNSEKNFSQTDNRLKVLIHALIILQCFFTIKLIV